MKQETLAEELEMAASICAAKTLGRKEGKKNAAVHARAMYNCKECFKAGARWVQSQIKINHNAAESLIQFLSTPIAKRKGVVLSKEECEEWVKELSLNDYEEESIERENNGRSSQIKKRTEE